MLESTATLLKKRLRRRCFPANFAKFLRSTFFKVKYRRLVSSIDDSSIKYRRQVSRSSIKVKYQDQVSTIQGQYPSNTTVIAGDSIINGIREERLSGKNRLVKVRNFPGAFTEDMQHNLIPILERNSCRLILHVGTNDAEACTSREILDKLLKLKTFISENCLQCQTIFSAPTILSDKAKANLTVKQLKNHLLQFKIDVVDNRSITDRCVGKKGLHLNISRTIQSAKNFVNFIKKF